MKKVYKIRVELTNLEKELNIDKSNSLQVINIAEELVERLSNHYKGKIIFRDVEGHSFGNEFIIVEDEMEDFSRHVYPLHYKYLSITESSYYLNHEAELLRNEYYCTPVENQL